WTADAGGNVDTNQPTGAIEIPYGQSISAQPTTDVTAAGNLDSRVADGEFFSTTIEVYDSLGAAHAVEVRFEKNGANTWDVTASGPDVQTATPNPAQIVFDNTGRITTPAAGTPLAIDIELTAAGAGGADVNVPVDINVDNLTQFASEGQ